MASDNEPVELEEPRRGTAGNLIRDNRQVWMRGLVMLAFAILFGIAETVLLVVTIIQFLWMLFARARNQGLAEFGSDLGKWLNAVARFQSGASDDKPFPWSSWPAG